MRKKTRKAIKQAKHAKAQQDAAPHAFIGFGGFDAEDHKPGCSCDRNTWNTIEKILLDAKFEERICPTSKKKNAHGVYAPADIDATDVVVRARVLNQLSKFTQALFDAGLPKNANESLGLLLGYSKRMKIRRFFHPLLDEK